MKLTKRKGFNFFRSYYDVYNELSDKDKVAFMDALLDRQFLGKKPENLKGMAKFAYISQTNSIDSQVKGYEDKTGEKLTPDDGVTVPPTVPPTDGGLNTPTEQVEEKEKEKEKEKKKKSDLEIALIDFKEMRDKIRKPLTEKAKKLLLSNLEKLAPGNDQNKIKILEQSIMNSWSSVYPLKESNNSKPKDKPYTPPKLKYL